MIRRRLVERARFVLSFDSAIDHGQCTYAKYAESGYDDTLLVFKAGEIPTVFVLAPLTHKKRLLVSSAPNEYARKCWIALLGIVDLHNYVVVDAQGRERMVAPPDQKDGMPQEVWLEQANLSEDELTEISQAVERIGSLSAPLSSVSGQVLTPG